MKDLLIAFAKSLLPEIIAIIVARQQAGETVTEADVMATLTARGALQAAQVDAWLAAHPEA